jgi:peptide/nickel transport system substrate-binding protein
MVTAGSAAGIPLSQLFQEELKKIGVQLNILPLDPTMMIQRVLSGEYQAAYLAWDLDPDPDCYALFHSSQFPPRGQNFVYYANPEVDRLLDEARRSLDRSRRTELYNRVHEILNAEQPYTWTVQVSVKWALNKRVRGVEVSRGYGLFIWDPGELGWWLAR